MKANEFVKKFGWSKAKEVSSFTSNVCEDPTHFDSDLDIYVHSNDFKGVMDESDICIHDLKRLIESHELVAIHGFEKSKEIVANAPSDDHFYSWTLGDSGIRDKTVNIGELRKAIADVESCQ